MFAISSSLLQNKGEVAEDENEEEEEDNYASRKLMIRQMQVCC